MIVTSYTRLVMESHRQSATKIASGFASRIRVTSPKNETREPFRAYEPVTVRLASSITGPTEAGELAVSLQSGVRNAA